MTKLNNEPTTLPPKPPRPLQKPGNVSIPPRPDPRITPTTMRGNYPRKQEWFIKQYLKDDLSSRHHWLRRLIDWLKRKEV